MDAFIRDRIAPEIIGIPIFISLSNTMLMVPLTEVELLGPIKMDQWNMDLDEKVEELVVNGLANGLTTIFVDNPKLMEELVKEHLEVHTRRKYTKNDLNIVKIGDKK